MDKPKVGPKDFFLWAGAMLAFYISVSSFISLFFSYIDAAYPDALNYVADPYSAGMRFAIASLIVLFPLFLFLTHLIRKDIQKDERKSELWVRRWALVLTIFIAGAMIAGDLITLINYFLGGELSTRFVLKVAIVLLVASGGLMHFLADLWGYWIKKPQLARIISISVSVAIVLSIGAAFLIMGTPGQVRLHRFDDQKVSDLQSIQSRVINYWQQYSALPIALSDLNDPLSRYRIPADPQTGQSYVYTTQNAQSFTLCATFNSVSQNAGQTSPYMPASAQMGGVGDDNWIHGEGQMCFMRKIDPVRYPSLDKNQPQAVPALLSK